jgi:hypothetical protein
MRWATDEDGPEQQHVALAHQSFGAGLVKDDPGVGGGSTPRRPGGPGTLALINPVMTLTDGALGGDHQVDAHGAGHLGDAGRSTPRRLGPPPS